MGGTMTYTFVVTGMHCASCGLLIDEALEETDGVHRAQTTEEMLVKLAEHYPMVTISTGGAPRVERFLEHYGVRDLFRAVVGAQTTRRMKPHPEPLLYAAKEMGVEPARCAVIEDSPLGVEGAVAAGMTAIGYTGGGHTYDGHGERLMSHGAVAACANWDAVRRELAARGFLD